MSLGLCNIDPNKYQILTVYMGNLKAACQLELGACPLPRASPDLHSIFHHSHVGLTLCGRIDSQFGWWNHKALAEGQPHAFPESVRKSAWTHTPGGYS